MYDNMLKHLKSQLAAEGIEAPESLEPGSPREIDSNGLGVVSGGFGQVVGFGQSFGETTGPGNFVQSFYQKIQ